MVDSGRVSVSTCQFSSYVMWYQSVIPTTPSSYRQQAIDLIQDAERVPQADKSSLLYCFSEAGCALHCQRESIYAHSLPTLDINIGTPRACCVRAQGETLFKHFFDYGACLFLKSSVSPSTFVPGKRVGTSQGGRPISTRKLRDNKRLHVEELLGDIAPE